MPTKSYAYSVGNVRAKEVNLLKMQDLEQMISLKTAKAQTAFLREKGFGDISDTDVSEILKTETKKLWDYIKSVSPDFEVFKAFIIPNDYHNLKAVFKGTIRDRDYENLLLSPSYVSEETLKDAINNKAFSKLPEYMREAAEKAYNALIKVGDVQLFDGILDASLMKAQLKLIETAENETLKDIIKTGVFFDNFKIAIRAARAKKDADFLEECLIEIEGTPKKELKKAALLDVDEVLSLLEKNKSFEGEKVAEAYRKNPSDFERMAENIQMKKARKGKYAVTGAEPLVGYLVARLTEIKAARIIANGTQVGETEDEIRGMLRELYG